MRKFILATGISCCACLALWAVWQFGYEGVTPVSVFRRTDEKPVRPAALDKTVSLDVVQRPLCEVLQELTAEHGVPLEIDFAAIKNAGLSADIVVSLRAKGVTLGTALDLLVEQGEDGLLLVAQDDGLQLTERDYWRGLVGNSSSRLYPLAGTLDGAESIREDDVARFLDDMVAPKSWYGTAGPDRIQVQPGALLIEQTPEVHRRIVAILAGCEELARDLTRREPLDIDSSPSARAGRRRILRALGQPTSLDVYNMRLDETLDYLASQRDIPIVVDLAGFDVVAGENAARVSHDLHDVRLDTALRVLLTPFDLTWRIHDDAIVVDRRSMPTKHSRLRIYPVGNLLQVAEESGDRLSDAAMRVSEHSHPYTFLPAYGVLAGMLVVEETDDNHRRIEHLLNELRACHGLDSRIRTTTPSERERSENIERALQQHVTLQFVDEPLDRALEKLLGSNVLFAYDRSCHDSGSELDAQVSLTARDVPRATVLSWLLAEQQLDYQVRDDVVCITGTWAEAEESLVRCHDVRRLAKYIDPDSLIDLITSVVSPENWPAMSGPGPIEAFGQALIIPLSAEVHAEVAALLSALEHRLDAPNSLEPIDAFPEPSQMTRRVLATLEQPTTLEFDHTPLVEAARRIAEQHHTPVRLRHLAPLWSDIDINTPITGRCEGMRLDSALQLLCRSLPPGVTVDVAEEAVSFEDRNLVDWNRMARIYPIRDLTSVDASSTVDVGDFVCRLIDAEFEATGRTTYVAVRDVLVVLTSRAHHRQLERLFDALRRMQVNAGVWSLVVEEAPDSAETRIREVLRRALDLEIDDEPLFDALRRIAREHDLPLWIDETRLRLTHPGVNERTTFTLCGTTLGRALEVLLAQHDLSYGVRHEVLIVTAVRPESKEPPVANWLELYNIGDLRRRYSTPTQTFPPKQLLEAEAELDSDLIVEPPPTFDEQLAAVLPFYLQSPTTMAIRIHSQHGDLLGVRAPAAGQRCVRELLGELRRAAGLPTENEQPNWLDRQMSLQCENTPLDEAICRLSREHQLPIGWARDLREDSAAPVTCDLHNVTLRDAVRALSTPQLPLEVIDDHGVVLVVRGDFGGRELIPRTYSLRPLLDRYPELDRQTFARLADVALRDKPMRYLSIQACGDALAVWGSQREHADVEQLLTILKREADQTADSSRLEFDDNAEAQQRLAERIASAEDPLQIAWCAALATRVKHPTSALTIEIARQWMSAGRNGVVSVELPLRTALEHCTRRRFTDVPKLAEALLDLDNIYVRRRLGALAESGWEGIDRLARRLEQRDRLPAKERDAILLVLALAPESARSAAPAVVEWLADEEARWLASLTLRTIDPEGLSARAYIEGHLASPTLSSAARHRLQRLRQRLNEAYGQNQSP